MLKNCATLPLWCNEDTYESRQLGKHPISFPLSKCLWIFDMQGQKHIGLTCFSVRFPYRTLQWSTSAEPGPVGLNLGPSAVWYTVNVMRANDCQGWMPVRMGIALLHVYKRDSDVWGNLPFHIMGRKKKENIVICWWVNREKGECQIWMYFCIDLFPL